MQRPPIFSSGSLGCVTAFKPRLPAHRRPQPDPRERPRTRRHAPDRAQEPRHLRPLQHHSRAGTARRRGPAGRLSGAAGAGGASPAAAPRGRPRRPAPCPGPPPRATRHRVRVHGPPGTGSRPEDGHRPPVRRGSRTGTTRPVIGHAQSGRGDRRCPAPGASRPRATLAKVVDRARLPGGGAVANSTRAHGIRHRCGNWLLECEGRSLAELEPTPPLAGDRACRYRATPTESDGLSSPSQTS